MCQSNVLRCDTSTIPPEHAYAREIAKYSPVLVIFPEDQNAGPPWRHSADYHPRAIEIYLDNANARSTNWWSAPGWMFLVTKSFNAIIDFATRILSMVLGRRSNPDLLRDMLGKEPDRGLPQMTLDSGVRPGREAWKRYFEIIAQDTRKYPHRCYVHVVRQGEDRVAIQYWFFYFFNDFWNTHQTDFEVVTVFLRRTEAGTVRSGCCLESDGGGLKPTGCYYGAHRGGGYRPWDSGVWKTAATHPIAFVAKGSHAMYAAPSPHIPELPWVELRWSFLNVAASIRQTYWGKPEPEEVVFLNSSQIESLTGGTYDVRIVPSSVDCIRPDFPPGNPVFWNEWWWLRFRGRWGPGNFLRRFLAAQPGVGGPAFHPRWDTPWSYLERCKAEIDWEEF